MASLDHSRQRIVYLIAYSRADTTKFPSKEGFSSPVVEAWQHFGIRVIQWVTCIEAHNNNNEWRRDESISLPYGLKTSKAGEMASSTKLLGQEVCVQVNFSDNHNLYYTAYQYVTKEDCEALHSSGHPDLTDAVPWTEAAKNF